MAVGGKKERTEGDALSRHGGDCGCPGSAGVPDPFLRALGESKERRRCDENSDDPHIRSVASDSEPCIPDDGEVIMCKTRRCRDSRFQNQLGDEIS